jgi:hypothetical protein
MKMPEPTLAQAGAAEVLTGRLAEYRELLDVLAERPGLTVVSSDPWSGTSALLAAAIDELPGVRLIVDARSCANSLDLAMTIADAAVTQLAPDAGAWWMGMAPPASTAGLRLSRQLTQIGIDVDALRHGREPGDRRLMDAIELLLALAGGEAVLAVDHAGLMLATLPGEEARLVLSVLRSARQDHPGLDLVLAEHPDGPVSSAIADPEHPLYGAGSVMRFRRPKPAQFVNDLGVTRAWTDTAPELVGAAAELARGVPALTWRVIDLAPGGGEDIQTRALAGWQRLRRITAPQVAREWDLLRRVHPIAQLVVSALSVGLRPHAVTANPKSVNDALSRLREFGVAWQPEPRRWALGDPLLGSWVREHAPPWASRRRRP